MASKQVLAIVVLASGVLNRTAIAEQLLEVIQAEDPEGTYVIEARAGEASLVPSKDEDWEFRIVRIVRELSFSDTATVSIAVTAHHEGGNTA